MPLSCTVSDIPITTFTVYLEKSFNLTVEITGHVRFPIHIAVNYGRPAYQMRTLYFCPVVSFFFFSSPNLSRRRLDVYHTSTHDDCGLSANLGCSHARPKRAARGWLKIQDAKNHQKNRYFATIAQRCRAVKAKCRQSEKKNLLISNTSSTCPHNMVKSVR